MEYIKCYEFKMRLRNESQDEVVDIILEKILKKYSKFTEVV